MNTRGLDPTEAPIDLLVRSAANRQPIGPLVLVILDGVGVGLGDELDAVATARTPTIDRLCAEGLVRTLRASAPRSTGGEWPHSASGSLAFCGRW
jgi:2,3-bisphosphoglycerate-independent phosphoglycerate mutase